MAHYCRLFMSGGVASGADSLGAFVRSFCSLNRHYLATCSSKCRRCWGGKKSTGI